MSLNALLKKLLIGANGKKGILAPIPLGNMNLGPEDELSARANVFMKDMLAQGRYQGIFFHVANESGGGGTKIQRMRTQQKKKAIGMVPGVFDWVFMSQGRQLLVDLKVGNGKLTQSQKDFVEWAEWAGIATGVARSVVELEELLVEAGFMSSPGLRQHQPSKAAQYNCSKSGPDLQPSCEPFQ